MQLRGWVCRYGWLFTAVLGKIRPQHFVKLRKYSRIFLFFSSWHFAWPDPLSCWENPPESSPFEIVNCLIFYFRSSFLRRFSSYSRDPEQQVGNRKEGTWKHSLLDQDGKKCDHCLFNGLSHFVSSNLKNLNMGILSIMEVNEAAKKTNLTSFLRKRGNLPCDCCHWIHLKLTNNQLKQFSCLQVFCLFSSCSRKALDCFPFFGLSAGAAFLFAAVI